MGCMCAERAGRGDCWAALYHLWKVSANGKGTWRLEDGQCYFSLQKGQEGSGKQIRPVVLTSIPWKVWDSLAAGSFYLLVFNFTCSPSSQIHWRGVFLLTPLRTPTLLHHIFTKLGKWLIRRQHLYWDTLNWPYKAPFSGITWFSDFMGLVIADTISPSNCTGQYFIF